MYRICTSCSERGPNVYADVHNICVTYTPAHAWSSTTPVNACRLSAKMHIDSCMRAHATVQQLLCHGSYCKLILRVLREYRAGCCLPPALPPALLPAICCQTLFALNIRPNPRLLMTRSLLRCCTSIMRSSALVQASSSLSMGRTHTWPCGSLHQEYYFRHFFARVSYRHDTKKRPDSRTRFGGILDSSSSYF